MENEETGDEGRGGGEDGGGGGDNKNGNDNGLKRKIDEVGESVIQGKKSNKRPGFVQDQCCWKASQFLNTCRDCTHRGEDSTADDEVCRFLQFRKLGRKVTEHIAPSGPQKKYWIFFDGFCHPFEDPTEKDIAIWMPDEKNPPKELEIEVCKELLTHLGDQLCTLFAFEEKAVEYDRVTSGGIDRGICWKRLVEGVRETCDVCITTLFNFHWICRDCGFVACLDCFISRFKEGKRKGPLHQKKDENDGNDKKDDYGWFTCKGHKVAKDKIHDPKEMQLTQLIPGNCLQDFSRLMHQVRYDYGLPQKCDCYLAHQCIGSNNAPSQVAESFVKETAQGILDGKNLSNNGLQDDKNVKIESPENGTNNEDEGEDEYSFLNIYSNLDPDPVLQVPNPFVPADTPSTVKPEVGSIQSSDNEADLKHFVRTERDKNYYVKKYIPAKTCRLELTSRSYPTLPHSWMCKGQLLKLEDPDHPLNPKAFQEVWKRGQPVVVSNVGTRLNKELWTPESFLKDYGNQETDLVNCLTSRVVPKQKVEDFWKGFLDLNCGMEDNEGNPMLLKLKDWPPTEDFEKFSPERFKDLMKALPLKDYTQRDGRLNLAARLPTSFVRPDLGPKMYIAYGDCSNLHTGTTVLHLDMSDAVNCMVYVGIPKGAPQSSREDAIMALKNAGVDERMIDAVKTSGKLPGALWHIYRPWDADKIRDLINKVQVTEKGRMIERNNDPIHDQAVYLDKELRSRLKQEYDVNGFTIAQCEGDAVFIPAGAPHQVRNLLNCIKIAEDFVTPENVSHCFQLTEEFRNLSDTHSNHEDKLQIKNIVYHAVKDAMSVLMHARPRTFDTHNVIVPEDLETLHELRRLVKSYKFGIHGCGFFKVNRKLALSMTGSIITFIVVLVQFRSPEP